MPLPLPTSGGPGPSLLPLCDLCPLTPLPTEPAAIRAALLQQRAACAQLRRLVRPAGQSAAVRTERGRPAPPTPAPQPHGDRRPEGTGEPGQALPELGQAPSPAVALGGPGFGGSPWWRACLPCLMTCPFISLAQLSESPASLPLCPPVETALINQRDLADALLDTERSLRELAQPAGAGHEPGMAGIAKCPSRHVPTPATLALLQVVPCSRPRPSPSTCSQGSGMGPSPLHHLPGPVLAALGPSLR